MLLIFPPVAKACEPPAGIARLAAALQDQTFSVHLWDANLEGQLWLLQKPLTANDTWSRRAHKNVQSHLSALRDPATYCSPDRHARSVSDLNRLAHLAGAPHQASISLADFQHHNLSPLRTKDLLQSAECFRNDPFFPFFSHRLTAILEEKGPNVIGFSLNYLSQALTTFAMAGYLRKHFPSIKIIMGGGLVTSWMARPGWANPFGSLIDELIAGPGENQLLHFLGSKAAPKNHLHPAYLDLPLKDYFAPGLILPYSAASGCYWNHCSFCPEGAEGSIYVPKPLKHVRSELEALITLHNPILIHFLDNAISPAMLRALADDPLGTPWYGFARIDTQLADIDFCRALRLSGCVMLKLGLESGDQSVLDNLHKGIELTIAQKVLENLRQSGIAVYLYLLFGTPPENETGARKTMDFVVRQHEAITFLNLAIFNMPIMSNETQQYVTEPFYECDLSLYTAFRHPHQWDRKQVRRFLQEFTRHQLLAPIVRRDPATFTSNHAPLFSFAKR